MTRETIGRTTAREWQPVSHAHHTSYTTPVRREHPAMRIVVRGCVDPSVPVGGRVAS